MSKWKSKCQKCGKETFYSRKQNIKRFLERGGMCRSCSHKGIRKSEEHKRKIGEANKGKTLGRRLSKETKQKMSLARKGEKNPMFGIRRYGKDNPNYGNNKLFGTHLSEETKIKISNAHKGKKATIQSKYKMRLSALDRVRKRGIIPYRNFNTKACEYFDRLNKEKGWNLRHALNGGEVEICGFFVDAFDNNKKIIVEYDEPQHRSPSRNKRDIERQKQIIELFNPKEFWRFSEAIGNLECQYKQ